MADFAPGFVTVRAGNHAIKFPSGMSPKAMHAALVGYYGPGNQQVPDSVSSYNVGQPVAAPQDLAGTIAAQPVKNNATYLFSKERLFSHGEDGTVTHLVKADG